MRACSEFAQKDISDRADLLFHCNATFCFMQKTDRISPKSH